MSPVNTFFATVLYIRSSCGIPFLQSLLQSMHLTMNEKFCFQHLDTFPDFFGLCFCSNIKQYLMRIPKSFKYFTIVYYRNKNRMRNFD